MSACQPMTSSIFNLYTLLSTWKRLCTEICTTPHNLLHLHLCYDEQCQVYQGLEAWANDRELQELATQWIDIENDEFIQEADIDEAIQELEMNDVTENENVELSDNDPMENEVDDNMDVDGNQNSLTNISSFLEASWHIEKLRRFGESIGASSQDLDLLSKLERSFRQIQLSKARSQPTITRFFSIRNSEAKDEEG